MLTRLDSSVTDGQAELHSICMVMGSIGNLCLCFFVSLTQGYRSPITLPESKVLNIESALHNELYLKMCANSFVNETQCK